MYLLANTLIGGLYLILLFGLCFSVVVGIKAVRIELKNRRKRAETPKEPPADEKKPAPSPTPPTKPREKKVYYIVEKKRTKRTKEQLGKPKRIEFRDQS